MLKELGRSFQSTRFKKVCVIGSGVMGSGIAAQLANAHVPCLLLDVLPKDPQLPRNHLALSGIKNALTIKPAAFFTKKNAQLIEAGNLEDDLEKVKGCDWVIEVVVENLAIKQKLFERLDGVVTPGTIVSSNTSGLSLSQMLQGRSAQFQKNFLVTHFFNPVRYLHLLEIVSAPQTDPSVISRVASFGEQVLGKGVVYGKDTPNFVANRIGVFGMMEIMRLMEQDGYSIEEVDAIFGPATGRPKSAVFRTADVVGLDTFIHVSNNCYENLKSDERHDVFKIPAFLTQMVEKGWLGQKSKQGFYKKEGTEILVLDIKDFTYKPKKKVRYDSLGAIRNLEGIEQKIKAMVDAEDRAGLLAWKVTASTCIYAANRLYEIADDVVQIDNAMKWGFGWAMGPFETWDAISVKASVMRMHKEGMAVPAWVTQMLEMGRESFYGWNEKGQRTFWNPRQKTAQVLESNERTQSLTILKQNPTNIVKDTMATTLVDLGDGVLGCEFHTKMNAIDHEVLAGVNDAIDLCEQGQFEALVIANEGTNFSVGANLFLLFMAAQQGEWKQIEELVKVFQNTCVRLRYSSIPTVAAPFQMTLGGGAEISLWCNHMQAHAELYMGLVEAGVGLIPGGGGNIAILARTLRGAVDDPGFPTEMLIKRAFETVAMAKVSTSAEEAREMMFVCLRDGITMNRRHLLNSAKQVAAGMAKAGFIPPMRRMFRLPGKSAYATFDMVLRSMHDGHFISEHDWKIARKIAHVMTGGDCTPRAPVTEQYLLDLECEAFLSLCGEEKTMARIAYMLENNKPLRN